MRRRSVLKEMKEKSKRKNVFNKSVLNLRKRNVLKEWNVRRGNVLKKWNVRRRSVLKELKEKGNRKNVLKEKKY